MLTVDGIPAHPLVVHAVVVLLPLAAVGTLLVVARPAWRRQLGVWVLLLALGGVAAVPVATQTGEQLEHAIGGSELIAIHEERAETLLIPAVIFLLLPAAALPAGAPPPPPGGRPRPGPPGGPHTPNARPNPAGSPGTRRPPPPGRPG